MRAPAPLFVRLVCLAPLAFAAACEGALPGPARVGSVRIVDPPAVLQVGETVRLNAVVLDPSDDPLSNVAVYWGAVDTMIVVVDSVSGIARARSPGATRIVVSSKDKRDTLNLTVPPGQAVAFNTFVKDDLSLTDDVDEFTFQGIAGQQVNVLLQGTSGAAAHQFRLRVLGPGGNMLDSVTSRGNDLDQRGQAIKWLRLPQAGTYRIRVDGSLGGDKGTYQVMVEPINPAPETASPTLFPGTPVTTESLSPGDIDTFRFSGSAGQEINIFFLGGGSTAADALRLWLLAPGGTELLFIQSHGDYKAAQPSGRLQLTQNGVYSLRVQGTDAADQGPYYIHVVPISRTPEVAASAVTANVQVANEAIAPPGDVDEFSFAVTAQQEVNVYLQSRTKVRADSLLLRFLRPNLTAMDSVRSMGDDSVLVGRAISHLSLPPATYRIQVEGGRNTQGPYTFLVRTINLAPETALAAYTLGTLVSSETISPVGDVDQFTFRATAGDALRITFQATSGSGSDVLRLYLRLPTGGEHLFVQATGNQLDQVFDTVLPVTGDYLIRVQGLNSSDDSGSYKFQIVKR